MSLSRQQWMQAQKMLDVLFQGATQQERLDYFVWYASVRQEMIEQSSAASDGPAFVERIKRKRPPKNVEAVARVEEMIQNAEYGESPKVSEQEAAVPKKHKK